jgi:small subunit ribosomal protein S4
MFLSAGDTISLKDSSKASTKFKTLAERPLPKWLTFDYDNLSGTVAQIPTRDDVDLQVKEHLIVELYSK